MKFFSVVYSTLRQSEFLKCFSYEICKYIWIGICETKREIIVYYIQGYIHCLVCRLYQIIK